MNDMRNPIIQNKRAPFDVQPGDYVFASRWSDCDPGDPWAVGFVEAVGEENIRLAGSQRYWPCAMKITREQGHRICERYPRMEALPLNYDAIAEVFGVKGLPDFKGYSPDGPVGMALEWLKSALTCPAFQWDGDQREYAEKSLKDAEQWLADLMRAHGVEGRSNG